MDENDLFSLPPEETPTDPAPLTESDFLSPPPPFMPVGNYEPTTFSSYPYDNAAFATAAVLPSYDSIRETAGHTSGTALASFASGMIALFFLAFWLIYPPTGLIMTLLSLALSLIGLRLGRQARRETPSNLADAGYMISIVGLVASSTFCLFCAAACVGLAGLVTALL